jgi:hypothetical protein
LIEVGDFSSIFLLIPVNVETFAMSKSLSTMPGCAGSLKPVKAWTKKGLTCLDCAWENYCLEYNYPDPVELVDLTDIAVLEQHG